MILRLIALVDLETHYCAPHDIIQHHIVVMTEKSRFSTIPHKYSDFLTMPMLYVKAVQCFGTRQSFLILARLSAPSRFVHCRGERLFMSLETLSDGSSDRCFFYKV